MMTISVNQWVDIWQMWMWILWDNSLSNTVNHRSWRRIGNCWCKRRWICLSRFPIQWRESLRMIFWILGAKCALHHPNACIPAQECECTHTCVHIYIYTLAAVRLWWWGSVFRILLIRYRCFYAARSNLTLMSRVNLRYTHCLQQNTQVTYLYVVCY